MFGVAEVVGWGVAGGWGMRAVVGGERGGGFCGWIC